MTRDPPSFTRGQRWLVAFGVAALPVGNLGFFGPAGVYLANPTFFAYPPASMLAPLLIFSVAGAMILAGLLTLLPARVFPAAIALTLAVGVAQWIQGNFLLWDYGVLQGGDLDWSEGKRLAWVGPTVWLGVMTAAWYWKQPLLSRARLLAGLVLLVQALATGITWSRLPARPSHQDYSVDTSRLFEFSPERNVIVIVLDSFQSSTFAQVAEEDPDMRQHLAGFTYYQNTTAGFAKTLGSVPSILTGRLNRNERSVAEYIHQAYRQSLPGELKKHGWRAELYPWVRQAVLFSPDVADNFRPRFKQWIVSSQTLFLLDVGLFRQVPHLLKPMIFNQNRWLFSGGAGENTTQGSTYVDLLQFKARLESATVSAKDHRSRFVFYHLQGPHAPFWLNRDLEPARLPQNTDGYHEQALASMRLMSRLIARLQELRVYDDSLIVITGDHGAAEYEAPLPEFPAGNPDLPLLPVPDHVRRAGTPMLLIKFPGQTGPLAISQKPAALPDLPATVFAALALENAFPGRPVQQLQEGEARERLFYHYGFGGWDHEYLPPLDEWSVYGHAWSAKAWRATGRIFRATAKEVFIPSDVSAKFGKGEQGNVLLGTGWAEPEEGYVWSNGRSSELKLDWPAGKSNLILEIELHPFLADQRVATQDVRLALDGEPLAAWQVGKPGLFKAWVPARRRKGQAAHLTFTLPGATSPKTVGLSDDPKLLGIALHSLRLISPSPDQRVDEWMEARGASVSEPPSLLLDRRRPRIIQLKSSPSESTDIVRVPEFLLLVDGATHSSNSARPEESAEILLPVARQEMRSTVALHFPTSRASGEPPATTGWRVITPMTAVLGQEFALGQRSSSPYCIAGWSDPEKGVPESNGQDFRWSDGRRAVLALQLDSTPKAARLRLRFHGTPLLAGPITAQRVNLTVNGRPAGSLVLKQTGTYSVDFPASLLVDNVAIVAFELPDAASPAFDLKLNEDSRRLGLRMETVCLEAAR